jgi:Protein of unknown function (DUF3775)
MEGRSSQTEMPADEDAATLTISPEKVCFIIVKAREFDAKDEVTEPDPGSNPSDDKDAAVLEDHSDDPVVEELTSLINSLSEDEQIDLVALMWLGRDDYSASDWPTVREEAAATGCSSTRQRISRRNCRPCCVALIMNSGGRLQPRSSTGLGLISWRE